MAIALLMRAEGELAPYRASLAALGLEVVAMPLLREVPGGDAEREALRAALGAGCDGILVASARAARPLAAAVGGSVGARLVAVGAATARALAEVGLVAQVAEGDGVSAAEVLLAAGCRRVVVPRAAAGREEVIERLRTGGAEVVPVTVYRTEPLPVDDPELAAGRELLRRGGAEVIGLFAPSQVAALTTLLAVDHLVPAGLAHALVIAIGTTTARALVDHGFPVDAIADHPDAEGMASAVARVYPRRP